MRKGLRIEGARPDGVLLVNLGDRQMVLVNVVDHVKTVTMSEEKANQFGPWTRFTDTQPDESVREVMLSIVDRPGNLVPPAAVGALDYDHRDVHNLAGPSRQDFAEMLEAASMDVGSELPQAQNFQDDPAWLQHCLGEIVPGLTAAGIEVNDPNSFCALMHLERTGIMPRGIAAVVVAPQPPQPALAAAVPPQPQQMAQPVVDPNAAPPVALSDEKIEDTDGDGKVNAAVAVEPSVETATELGDDEPDGDEPGAAGESDMVAEMVTQIEEALDTAEGLVVALLDKLGIPDPDEAKAEDEGGDKSKALTARLTAIRNFKKEPAVAASEMPMIPSGAALPVSAAAPLPVQAAAPLPLEPLLPVSAADGKPEMPKAAADAVEADTSPKGAIGKPNKKVSACGTGAAPAPKAQ